jgi:predicted permease
MQPLYKILVIAVFIGILVALGSALYQLSRTGGDSKKMVRALAIRVGLSIALFLLLMILWYLGIITPHGL